MMHLEISGRRHQEGPRIPEVASVGRSNPSPARTTTDDYHSTEIGEQSRGRRARARQAGTRTYFDVEDIEAGTARV
jgi:hypothetical protein